MSKNLVNIIIVFEDGFVVREMKKGFARRFISTGHAWKLIRDGEFFEQFSDAKEYCQIAFQESNISFYIYSKFRKYPISHARNMEKYLLENA